MCFRFFNKAYLGGKTRNNGLFIIIIIINNLFWHFALILQRRNRKDFTEQAEM